ncbi:MAG: hypothetical protein ACI9YL_002224 [Luteibaculaceae bacterium]
MKWKQKEKESGESYLFPFQPNQTGVKEIRFFHALLVNNKYIRCSKCVSQWWLPSIKHPHFVPQKSINISALQTAKAGVISILNRNYTAVIRFHNINGEYEEEGTDHQTTPQPMQK